MLIIFNKVVLKKIYHLKYFGGVNENYILFGKNSCWFVFINQLIFVKTIKENRFSRSCWVNLDLMSHKSHVREINVGVFYFLSSTVFLLFWYFTLRRGLMGFTDAWNINKPYRRNKLENFFMFIFICSI